MRSWLIFKTAVAMNWRPLAFHAVLTATLLAAVGAMR